MQNPSTSIKMSRFTVFSFGSTMQIVQNPHLCRIMTFSRWIWHAFEWIQRENIAFIQSEGSKLKSNPKLDIMKMKHIFIMKDLTSFIYTYSSTTSAKMHTHIKLNWIERRKKNRITHHGAHTWVSYVCFLTQLWIRKRYFLPIARSRNEYQASITLGKTWQRRRNHLNWKTWNLIWRMHTCSVSQR